MLRTATLTVVVVFEVGVVATAVVPVLVGVEAAGTTGLVGGSACVIARADVRCLRPVGPVAGAVGIGGVRRRSLVLTRILPTVAGVGARTALTIHAAAALVLCGGGVGGCGRGLRR